MPEHTTTDEDDEAQITKEDLRQDRLDRRSKRATTIGVLLAAVGLFAARMQYNSLAFYFGTFAVLYLFHGLALPRDGPVREIWNATFGQVGLAIDEDTASLEVDA